MRFLLVLVLFASLSASIELPVIDLYPIIMGFDAVPPSAGDQSIWLTVKSFMIDLDEVDLPKDHLWELSVYTDRTVGGVLGCDYSIGYVLDGNWIKVRAGGIGGDDTDGDMIFIQSSAVLWLRGNEVEDGATDIYVSIENCAVGRYVTRWAFEEWNGLAYLMDWSGNTWIRPGFEDQTLRTGDWDEVNDEGYFPLSRDDTIYKPGVGYWFQSFFLDLEPFEDIENPVLEFWLHSAQGDDGELYFYFCDYAGGNDCREYDDYDDEYNSYVYWDYEDYESGLVRIFFDISASLAYGPDEDNDPFGEDPWPTLHMYMDSSYYSIGAPYAKMWNWNNATLAKPFLMDGHNGVTGTGDCESDVSYYEDAGIQWDGIGFPIWSCGDLATATTVVSWTLPEGIEEFENPWMSWYEWSDAYDEEAWFTITMNGTVIHTTYIYPQYDDELKGWDRQIAFGPGTWEEGDSISVRMLGNSMNFMGAIPVFEGPWDYCELAGDPCENGGECHNWYYRYTCICPIGWEGDNCTISTDDCHLNSCLNGGECVDDFMSYSCNCTEGYSGDRCEVLDDWCPQDACLNGGLCVPGENNRYSCDCADGFSGRWCEVNDDNCNVDPYGCGDHGECVSDDTLIYVCDCDDGWTGDWCEINTLCDPNPCENEGDCYVSTDGTTALCHCTGAYFGDSCQYVMTDFIGNCGGTICYNGGVCIEAEGVHSCRCDDPSYTGQFCEDAVVCNDDNNPCQNDGLCTRGDDGVAVCHCAAGWTGETCEEEIWDVVQSHFAVWAEDCRFGEGCWNGGSCAEQTDGTYACECTRDYYGDYCESEVACSPNPCHNDGHCVRGGNGLPKCICTPGWTGDWCEDDMMEELSSGFDVMSEDCRLGYPCENGGSCEENDNGAFVCVCPDDFFGDSCEKATACNPSPCGDYGRCEYANGEALCFCSSNMMGPNCEYTMDYFLSPDCRFKPCENGGICYLQEGEDVHEYACSCPEDYVGDFCETHAACDPNPCGENGVCAFVNDTASCICAGNVYGDNCESDDLTARVNQLMARFEDLKEQMSSSSALVFSITLFFAVSLLFL